MSVVAGLIYTFPTAVEADVMTQEYFVEREKFLGEEYLPFEEKMTSKVRWDELDNARGMTAVHKMGTDPQIDDREGSRTREYTPIPFKETDVVTEEELLLARELGTLNNVVNIDSLVARIIRDREDKNFIRAEALRFDLFRGQINVHENGVRVRETFNIQTYDPIVEWDDLENSTPLRDIAVVQQMAIGTGATSDGATILLRSKTFNLIFQNKNANDLRLLKDATSAIYDIDTVNKLMAARNLPQFRVYDQGYHDENGNFKFFIEEGDLHVILKRPKNQKVGAVAMTPTLHRIKNGRPAPGMFSIIEVNGQAAEGMMQFDLNKVGLHKNPKLEITGGWYGGPFARYARSIIRIRATRP